MNATGWIVKSAINPNLYYCDNGEWLATGFFGPGHKVGVKVYRTVGGALRVRNGSNIIVERIEDMTALLSL